MKHDRDSDVKNNGFVNGDKLTRHEPGKLIEADHGIPLLERKGVRPDSGVQIPSVSYRSDPDHCISFSC